MDPLWEVLKLDCRPSRCAVLALESGIRLHLPMHGSSTTRPRLVVFSDDWGRHRSSAQFLATEFLERYDIDWVETVGTRSPSLSWADARRGVQKLALWVRPPARRDQGRGQEHPGLRIHAPLMWPSFRSTAGRAFNARAMRKTLRAILSSGPTPRAIISTVPLVADVARSFPNQHWIYYCVDALHEWESLDRPTLESMEAQWIKDCSAIVAASDDLAERLQSAGASSVPGVVEHGVNYGRWSQALPSVELSGPVPSEAKPVALFFGAVDERVDPALCERIAASTRLVMVGPKDRAPAGLRRCANLELWGPRPHEELPGLAAAADVLVLPYRTDATTASLSPLKLKEYMSTEKPVVASGLPAASQWSDGLDVADDDAAFVELVVKRASGALPPDQLAARQRLHGEGWDVKAREAEAHFAGSALAGPVTVLHVRSCGGPGSGPEKTLMRSHQYGDPSRYRIVVALLTDPDDREVDGVFEEAQALGADFVRVDDRGPLDRDVLHRLVHLVRERGATVWHGHDAKSNLLGLRARRRSPLWLVATAHGWVHRTSRTPVYDRLDRWAIRRNDGVISVSREIEARVGLRPAPKPLTRVITNGVDTRCDEPLHQRAPGDPFTIGAVGRLEAEKNLPSLLRATAALRARGVDARAVLFGTGSLAGELASLAQELGIADAFELRGFVRDRRKIFTSIDALALPSLREGTPNSLLEAMAHGLPIAATTVGGVPELVRDGVDALLCPPDDDEALVSALALLAQDPQLARSLGAAARAAARERHSFRARMEKVFAFYDELLAGPTP